MAYRKVRPQKYEKVDRNFMLLDLSKSHPEYTYDQLGKAFGISRQRAFTIVARKLREADMREIRWN